jgi:hypothetical protein
MDEEIKRRIEEKMKEIWPVRNPGFTHATERHIAKEFAEYGYGLAQEEIQELKESLATSERFRTADAFGSLMDTNDLRAEIARLRAQNEKMRDAIEDIWRFGIGPDEEEFIKSILNDK